MNTTIPDCLVLRRLLLPILLLTLLSGTASPETTLRTGGTLFSEDRSYEDWEYWGEIGTSQYTYPDERNALFFDGFGRIFRRSEGDLIGVLGSVKLEGSRRRDGGVTTAAAGAVVEADDSARPTFTEIFLRSFLSGDHEHITVFLEPEVSWQSYHEESVAGRVEVGLSNPVGDTGVLRSSLTGSLRRHETGDLTRRGEVAVDGTWYRDWNTIFGTRVYAARSESDREYEIETLNDTNNAPPPAPNNSSSGDTLPLDNYYELGFEPSGSFAVGEDLRIELSLPLRYRLSDHNAVADEAISEERERTVLFEPELRLEVGVTDRLQLGGSATHTTVRSNSDYLEGDRGKFEAFLEWKLE